MTIEEIFALPRKKESLKKIDSFIESSSVEELCHHQAICIKCLTLNEIGKPDEALKLILPLENEFPHMDKRFSLCYCDTLKEIFMSLKQYEKALNYIQMKKLYLNLMDHDAYKKDMILFHLAQNHKGEAKRWLNSYLNDDIADEDRIFAYERLIDFHYEEHDTIAFYKVYNKLRDYYLDMLDDQKCNQIDIMKVHMLLSENKTEEALEFSKDLINSETIDDDNIVSLANIIIDIYVQKRDYKRASIVDSNFYEKAKKANPQIKIKYFETTKMLYTKLNNKFSIDYAQSEIELAKLEAEHVIKEEEKTVNRRIKKAVNVEPIVIEKIIEKKSEVNIVEQPNTLKQTKVKGISYEEIEVSYLYENLYEIFDYISKIDNQKTLRDILREAFIYIKEKIAFDEAVVLLKDNNLYGYHYKMERLYDKKFDLEKISNSIPYRTFESKNDTVTRNACDNQELISAITLKPTEFNNQVSIPLFYNGDCIGSITYLSKEEDLIKELKYESLKIITNILNTKIDHV